jgi:hypothetical protein
VLLEYEVDNGLDCLVEVRQADDLHEVIHTLWGRLMSWRAPGICDGKAECKRNRATKGRVVPWTPMYSPETMWPCRAPTQSLRTSADTVC